MAAIELRALDLGDEEVADGLFTAVIGGRNQARLGEVHDVLALPGVAAWSDDGLVGVATYRIDGERAELAAFAVAEGHRRGGTGQRRARGGVRDREGAGRTRAVAPDHQR